MNLEATFIAAEKPDTGKRTVTRVIVDTLTGKMKGGSDKTAVNVLLTNQKKERSIPMVMKSTDEVAADTTYDYWKLLARAGVPTLTTMRVVSDHEVLVNNAVAADEVVYGKHDVIAARDRHDAQALQESDAVFLSLQEAEVRNRAQQIADQATNHLVALPDDDPLALLLKTDGSYRLLVLDIDVPLIHQGSSPITRERIRELNDQSIDRFMEFIARNKRALQTGNINPTQSRG